MSQTLAKDSISLAEGLSRLSQKYHIKFAFDHAQLNQERVSWTDNQHSLESSLSQILEGKKYRFEIQDDVVLIIPNKSEIRKNIAITGTVVDEKSGEPLPNATVSLPTSGKYTITNQEGKFSFVNVPYDTSTIYVRYLGYDQHILNIQNDADQTKMNVNMKASSSYLEDVVVTDHTYQVLEFGTDPSHITLDLKEFNSIANFGEPDVFRAVQLLPGISATNETSSGLIIRGGSPEQNLILFDGFTVYHLDHFFGIYSAFNSNVIKDVQLHKSGYGAKWGTRVSGVMDITGKSGNTRAVSGNIGVNLISANAMLEIPVSDKTFLLVAGRRAYTDIIQSDLYKKLFDHSQSNELRGTIIQEENFTDEPITSDFYFYDMNVKATHHFTDNDVIQLSYYQGKDDLNQSNTYLSQIDEDDFSLLERIQTQEHLEWGNYGSSLVYSRLWNNQWYSKVSFSASNFFRNQNFSQEYSFEYDSLGAGGIDEYSYLFRNENEISEFKISLDAEYKISDRHILDMGIFSVNSDVRYQNFYDATLEDSDLNIEDDGSVVGGFAQYTFQPDQKLLMKAGLRVSGYSLMPNAYWEPRFSLRYNLKPTFYLKMSYGKYYQYVVNVGGENPTLNAGDFWLMGGQDGVPVLESDHYVFGFNWNNRFFEIDGEAYYKSVDNLSNYIFASSLDNDDDGFLELFFQGQGKVYGVDFMLKKDLKYYTGWVSYTLSKNQNRFSDVNNGDWYASDYDERHELKFVNMVNFKKWELSATWIYGSGRPYSVNTSNSTDSTFFDFGVNVENPNSKRIPAYHKLDLGVSYLQKLHKGQLRLGLNLLNVYNRKNIKSINQFASISDDSNASDQSFSNQKVELLGFTPSIFVNYSF
ncbi:TonB-dependent receptor [Reichenbachiella sp.]|uniref:TonB-dependent receptor n=1 Tax=Reichenbachiella sp. TaxID=2184521 RepID=UPI003BAFC47E